MTDKAPIKTNKRLQQTQAQVNEVVDIMRVNVDKVLERDKNLSELDGRADALQAGASQFEASAGKLKRKFWWKNCKMLAVLGVLVVILIIVLIVWVVSEQKNKVEQSEHSSHHLVMDNSSHLLSEPVMMGHSREGKPIFPDHHMISLNEINTETPSSFNSNKIKSKGFKELPSPPSSLSTSSSYSPSFSSYPSLSQHHFENNETSLF
ncbi:unnamed protein product [Schistosoma rodhaini]|uniref:V-SNARE coiled-coil homology domain-containing protein n=1 Tax=Schistosoma rodhaini TaxID=6188 RepID=A0AA85EMZ3_9TREM|nr:unnamed protein product [Schistosoma rodhaini]CAH8680748.1 unnamed protein product [Schistosoma rodhaini]